MTQYQVEVKIGLTGVFKLSQVKSSKHQVADGQSKQKASMTRDQIEVKRAET